MKFNLSPVAAALAGIVLVSGAAQAADETAVGQLDAVNVTADRYQFWKPDVTEDTKSYGLFKSTGATRINIRAQETPQTIVAATQQQMKDFQATDLQQALTLTPGVTVDKSDYRTVYSSRGFEISNILTDGIGMPIYDTYGSYNQVDVNPDTFLYDRVEVIKGADALTNFSGNPGATINLVRKRPTKELQGSVQLSYGSWNTKRAEIDVSGPLSKDGRVRGRVMGYEQKGESYLNKAGEERNGIAAIVEADLTDSTLLTVGASRTNSLLDGVAWGQSPTLNTAAATLAFDRRFKNPDWTYADKKITNYFVSLDQELGSDWKLKLNYDYTKTDSKYNLYYLTGSGSGVAEYYYGGNYSQQTNQGDISLTGKYHLFGREHEAFFGYTMMKDRNYSVGRNAENGDTGNYFANADDWYVPSAANLTWGDWAEENNYRLTYSSWLAATRFHITDDLKLIVGGNYVRAKNRGTSSGSDLSFDANKFSPYVGLTYDFAPNYTGYVSYTSIFRPQATVNSELLANSPVKGKSWETGVKGSWLDDSLHGSVALFRTVEDNYPVTYTYDVSRAGYLVDTGNIRSQGIEFNINGEITENLSVSAGLTFYRVKDRDSGERIRTYNPATMFSVSAAYTVPQLPGLKVGGAVRWQSTTSNDFAGSDGTVTIRQGGYALVDLMASYDINKHVSVQANGYNITNKKYLTTLSSGVGPYSSGANYMVSVKLKL